MLLVLFLELEHTLKLYILILVIRLLLHKYLRLLRVRVLLWGPLELSILVKGQEYRTRVRKLITILTQTLSFPILKV